MAIVLDGTAGITSGPISGTTGSFSGDVLLGSSVLATPVGSAPSYTCRAWVNFNGTGTVAIRASGNVSSITDNAVGSYSINMIVPMSDENYSGVSTSNGYPAVVDQTRPPTSSSWSIYSFYATTTGGGQARIDATYNNVAIFR
jgi:hypothetical protein